MALEAATYINNLVITNPDPFDTKSQGDDHMRLIKRVLKNTFPNITGPITVGQDTINKLGTDNILCFPGMIVMWSGTIASIPAGWKLCNGVGNISNGVSIPNLTGRFVIHADADTGGTYNRGSRGGSADSVVVAHSHAATATEGGEHSHSTRFNNQSGVDGDYYGAGSLYSDGGGFDTGVGGAHGHKVTVTSTGETGVGKNVPPYYALAYIIKD